MQAGVPEDEFPSLRKSCITNWLEAQVLPHRVQALAGHSDIKTTISFYAKIDLGETMDQARTGSSKRGVPLLHGALVGHSGGHTWLFPARFGGSWDGTTGC